MAAVVQPGSIEEVRQELGISRERMAWVFDVSSRTIDRWEKRPSQLADVANAQTLQDLHRLIELGQVVYGEDGFRQFLVLPMPAPGGRTPMQTIERGDRDRVLALVAQDYEGLGA